MKTQFEGKTTFASMPDRSFRYKILSDGECIQFWLEDCTSKFQWQSNELGAEDLPLFHSSVLEPKVSDYATIFEGCFCDADEITKRSLVQNAQADKLILTFTLKLSVFAVVWEPKFKIPMRSVPLEPIQIANAKIRDLSDEVAALQETVNKLQIANEQLQNQMNYYGNGPYR